MSNVTAICKKLPTAALYWCRLRLTVVVLLNLALSGCGQRDEVISTEEMEKKVLAIEQNFPMTALSFPLKAQSGKNVSGSARIEALRIGAVRGRGFPSSQRPAFLLEGLTVDTDGDDLRVLSEIAPNLKTHGLMNDLIIKGLRVRKLDGTLLLESAEARSTSATSWEMRGVRVGGGMLIPLGELNWGAATEPVLLRPLQERRLKNIFR
jgi:hypothetical protein